MALAINILLFVLSCVVLIISGSFLVRSFSKIAAFLKMSEFILSFLIIGFATSLPELFIGITSAIAKNPALSLGNVIGSNIANLTIIIGIPILLVKGIKIRTKTLKKDSLYMFFIATVPLVLMWIGKCLSRIDGIILVAIFVLYSVWLIKQRKAYSAKFEDHIGRAEIVFNVFIFIIAVILLYFSASFTVKYATMLSMDLLLPPIFIGLFILALGTSLPELTIGFQSVLKKHPDIAIGNIIGSVVINSTLVLGVTSMIYPITADLLLFFTSMGFMIITAFLFTTFIESGNKLYWKEGVAMIIIYVFFIMMEMYISRVGGV
ncbi:MAG: sodium:calcium antiporter [Nanoarchaeota archaeon]|nr:sodium:calcium antiporter [Nanoarchaeota archaeon]